MNTRRYLVLSCLGFTLLFLLAACGGNATNDPVPLSDPASSGEPTPANAMRTVQTIVGEIEIPADPQRVIVDWNVGHVLALGITPVGIPFSLLDYGVFLRDQIPDSVEDIGMHYEVSLEKLIALEPDLIITYGQDKYDTYSKIAPTLVFDASAYDSTEEQVLALGVLLDKEDEAKAWNTSFAQRIEAARAKVKQVIPDEATFTIVEYNWDKSVVVVGLSGNRGGTTVYDLLQRKPHPRIQSDVIDKGEYTMIVSWEVIDQYVGDYLIDLRASDATETSEPTIWPYLSAVQNDQVYELDIRKYFTDDPISFVAQAEELAERLASGQTKLLELE